MEAKSKPLVGGSAKKIKNNKRAGATSYSSTRKPYKKAKNPTKNTYIPQKTVDIPQITDAYSTSPDIEPLAWNVAYDVENSTAAATSSTDAHAAIEEATTAIGDAPSIQEMQSWSFDRLEAYRKQVSKSESRARLENLSTKAFWANRKELVDELYRARIAAEGVKKKAYNTKPKNKGGAHELYLNV